MKFKNTLAAFALVVMAGFMENAASASPINPTHGFAVAQKSTQTIHYRSYRHCHHRNGHRRCHGGNAYYNGGPGIYLGLGVGSQHYRGNRGGGRDMHNKGRH